MLLESNSQRFENLTPHLRKGVFLFILVLMVLCLASYWSNSFSLDTEKEANSKYPLSELVSEISKGKAEFVSSFEGPEGLTGLIIKGNSSTGKKRIAWYPDGSDVLIFGPVVNKNGQDLTTLSAQEHIHSNTTPAEKGIQAQNMASFLFKKGQGSKVRHLYIFVSSSCPVCRTLLQQINGDTVKFEDDVQVSLIPIAQNAQGRIKGARFLETGSFAKSNGTVSPDAIANVAQNTEQLLSQTKSRVETPMLVHEGQIINSFSPFIVSSNTGN